MTNKRKNYGRYLGIRARAFGSANGQTAAQSDADANPLAGMPLENKLGV